MWKELVANEVWYTENFIKDDTVDKILDKINSAETKVLDGNEQPHIISKSYYNYNHVKYNVREDSGVVAQIIIKLNEVLDVVHKPLHIQDINEDNVLQFTTKTFNPDSIYNVHTERKDIYGDFVFVNYLTDEDGGELVFPDQFMLNKHFEEYPKERANWLEFKRKLAEKYRNWMVGKGVEFVSEPAGARSNYWLNAILLNSKAERDDFLQNTNTVGVMTRPMWTPMHTLPMYRECFKADLKNSDDIEARLVCIPSSAR